MGNAGRQSRTARAFAFDAPRISHMIATTCVPMSRATQRGTWRGGRAPIVEASAGSHSRTGAGSSSTTLNTSPGAARSSAATVAPAASSMWMNDQTPPPSPTSGNFRAWTIDHCSPPGASPVPGP